MRGLLRLYKASHRLLQDWACLVGVIVCLTFGVLVGEWVPLVQPTRCCFIRILPLSPQAILHYLLAYSSTSLRTSSIDLDLVAPFVSSSSMTTWRLKCDSTSIHCSTCLMPKLAIDSVHTKINSSSQLWFKFLPNVLWHINICLIEKKIEVILLWHLHGLDFLCYL